MNSYSVKMQKGKGGKKAKYGSNPLGKYDFQDFLDEA
jgi:hypothetical protein